MSCSNAPAPVEEVILKPKEVVSPQSSGKTLNGEYVLRTAEDDYRIASEAYASVLFDQGGAFKRLGFSDKAIAEEGAYFISTADELVFFVERIGDEQLPSAMVERYLILEWSDSRLKLQADRAGAFFLEKK